jgi:hypothetical protein
MQTDCVQGSAQHADYTSFEPGAAQSQFLRVFSCDRDHEVTVTVTLLHCAAMSIQLYENITPVTIFGNFCVILTLLRKLGRRAAEFIVNSLRAQPHTERRGAACRLWFRYLEIVEPKHTNSGRWAAQGVRSGAAKQGTNSFVSRSVYERLTLFIFFFSPTVDVVCLSRVSRTWLRMYSKVSFLKY